MPVGFRTEGLLPTCAPLVPRPAGVIGETVNQIVLGVLTGEYGVCFVVECLVARLIGVAGAHCEDESSRTGHWLYACEVICDQVRHRASDQGDQNGVETSGRTCCSSRTGESTVTYVVGWLLSQHSTLIEGGLLTEEFLLVFEQDCGYALLWLSLIGSRPSWLRRGAHFSCNCSDWNICF